MMFRFNLAALIIAFCALPAWAERVLSRTEVLSLITDRAVCYQDADGSCYAAEFFERMREDTIDVVYALAYSNNLVIVRERATWNENSICVTGDASGILKVWDTEFGDKTFVFDLSNAQVRTPEEIVLVRSEFGASRASGYCYYFTSEDAGLTGLRSHYELGAETASAPFIVIDLDRGAIEMN